ncbi:MAG: hypothetical protein LBV41_08795 [Cytophagaceae bacterium]|jgi:hypothetical protein|nr:hypothetical protein [Cytophagaceae bacterium]
MEKIIIERCGRSCFNVIQGDKYSDQLGFEEMLGLIAALTMPKEPPCIHWMKTKQDHEDWRNFRL